MYISRNRLDIYNDKIKNILISMGYIYVNGPEIENEWNNFTSLNISQKHLSRQEQDTFYINSIKDNNNHVLRTHTSSLQSRYINKKNIPLKLFSIGKVFRIDEDKTHNPIFHQLECFNINSKTNIMNLKKFINKFMSIFFNKKNIQLRLRDTYFPFTNPSFEIDIKKEQKIKQKRVIESPKWIEILGCGIINRKVIKNNNINNNNIQGFALGAGIERLIMISENIYNIKKI